MTRRKNEELDRLERCLAEVHRARPAPVLNAGWAQSVMRRIRCEAAGASGGRIEWVDHCVWRTATAAAAFAVVLAGSVVLFETGGEKGELTALLSAELEPTPALLE